MLHHATDVCQKRIFLIPDQTQTRVDTWAHSIGYQIAEGAITVSDVDINCVVKRGNVVDYRISLPSNQSIAARSFKSDKLFLCKLFCDHHIKSFVIQSSNYTDLSLSQLSSRFRRNRCSGNSWNYAVTSTQPLRSVLWKFLASKWRITTDIFQPKSVLRRQYVVAGGFIYSFTDSYQQTARNKRNDFYRMTNNFSFNLYDDVIKTCISYLAIWELLTIDPHQLIQTKWVKIWSESEQESWGNSHMMALISISAKNLCLLSL